VRSLRIHTLGRCELTLDDRLIPDEAWRGPHAKRLLLILVSRGRGTPVPRDEMIDLLRSSGNQNRALTDFYGILHQIQAVLGRPADGGSAFLRLQGARVLLDAEYCWADCWGFDEAVSSAKRYETYGQGEEARRVLAEARALYRGPFLPEVREGWAEAKRHSVQRQFVWVEQRDKRL